MPYSIKQTAGPVVDAIKAITAAYWTAFYALNEVENNMFKSERTYMHPELARTTFNALRDLYMKTQPDGTDVRDYDTRNACLPAKGRAMDAHYMISIWFPMYINMPWSDGSEWEGQQKVAELEAETGHSYSLEHEY